MPHSNKHERVHFLHSVVFWHQNDFIWKERIARAVLSLQLSFHISKHSPIPFLPYSLPPKLISFSFSVSTLIYYPFTFPLALSWSSFFFLLFLMCYSLNHSSLMSFSLTFFICQCVSLTPTFYTHHSPPSTQAALFEALITRPGSTLTTHPTTLVQTNLIFCFFYSSAGRCCNWSVLIKAPAFEYWRGLACSTACEQVCLEAYVCKTSRVSRTAPGGDTTRAVYDSSGTKYWQRNQAG